MRGSRGGAVAVIAVSVQALLAISRANAFVLGSSLGLLGAAKIRSLDGRAGGLPFAAGSVLPRRLARGALIVRACDDATDGEGFRPANAADKDLISKMVREENMNPLFIDPVNFLIAQDDEAQVVGIGQVRPLGKNYELASLAVRKDMRGNGIGTALVNELLERQKAKLMVEASDPSSVSLPDVFLLTLVSSTPFYSRMGFLEIPVSMAPMGMQMEAAAGSFVAKMSGGELTCMRYKFPSTELKCSGSGTVLKQANQIGE